MHVAVANMGVVDFALSDEDMAAISTLETGTAASSPTAIRRS